MKGKKDIKNGILAVLILLIIVCGVSGVIEIIKGLISDFFDLIEIVLL